MNARAATIRLDGGQAVSGLWMAPEHAQACLVLAHGAGAGMMHKGMTALAEGLAARAIATLRFNFPFMERGSKRPDAPAIAHNAVRAAVAETGRLAPGLPLFAGGRSYSGRMTSQAHAQAPLPGVRGLVFFAFPLHPAGKPGIERARHLDRVALPMLFLQGDRDALSELALLGPVVDALGARARLHVVRHADHSFHVPARSGRSDDEALADLLDAAAAWMGAIAA